MDKSTTMAERIWRVVNTVLAGLLLAGAAFLFSLSGRLTANETRAQAAEEKIRCVESKVETMGREVSEIRGDVKVLLERTKK